LRQVIIIWLIKNKTLNFSERNKVYFLETFEKLGFDRIIHQSRNLVNVKNYNYKKKSLTNFNNDSNGSTTTEPTFIDDFDNEISDFDEYAENYERPRNKVYANIKMPETDNPSVSSADSSLYTREPVEEAELSDEGDTFTVPRRNTADYSEAPHDNTSIHSQRQVFMQGRQKYGLDSDVIYAKDEVSVSQKDIDERLGRNFIIPNEEALATQTDIRDRFDNSLHFSDNVIFTVHKNGFDELGAGRIVNFEINGSDVDIVVSVDSGITHDTEIKVKPSDITFVSHNNSDTISADYKSQNIMYERAKYAYDSFILGNNSADMLRNFSFGDAQYYLTITNSRLSMLERKLNHAESRYDEGIQKVRGVTPGSTRFDYMQHAEYTININPFIKEFRELGQFLSDGKSELRLTDLNSFIQYLDRFTNSLAKKTSVSDRFIIEMLGSDGRNIMKVLSTLNNRMASNAILAKRHCEA